MNILLKILLVPIILFIICLIVYLFSKLQMRAWLKTLEEYLENTYTNLKEKENEERKE